jgi:leucyl/phenylalanyl-tRNA---protein transferase
MSAPLTTDLIVAAYRQGYFPMADETGRIRWFGPDPRAILPLDAFHVPRRLARSLRRTDFSIRLDHDFEAVIRGCADREETWISDEIARVYSEMHRKGKAHSVEVYDGNQLVGGTYGVALGGAFMGESMFSRVSGASSASLIYLAGHLSRNGYELFDIQFLTPHLQRFGALEIPRTEYQKRLGKALRVPCVWSPGGENDFG